MLKNLSTIALATLLGGCVVYLDEPDPRTRLQHMERTLTLDAGDLNRLVATAGAGSLEIRGADGLENIEVIADIYASSADDVRLTLVERSGEAVLSADFARSRDGRGDSRIDLVVKVPSRFELDVEDGSGYLAINGVASVEVDDGSGHMDIKAISGDVRVRDGSGHLSIVNVGGMVTVSDGSGNITIEEAAGLTLLESGSGRLSVTSVRGPMRIED